MSRNEPLSNLDARLRVQMHTGLKRYAHVFIGKEIITVSVEPNISLKPDEPLWLELDQDKIHLFDGVTQRNLTAL